MNDLIDSYRAEYERERARSQKLLDELQYIVDHGWTAKPHYDIAWKWINEFVDGAKKAIAEYKASL